MQINIKHEITASEIVLSEQELLDNFVKNSGTCYSMFKIADKALSEVSWHNNMPKSLKLHYISMLTKHIEAFMKDID
jgi:hypothetical protein